MGLYVGQGPLNVIRMDHLTEDDYRSLKALSYSRLSDIEKIGVHAVNAKAQDIGKLRGISIGSIVDRAISERLNGIPKDIYKVNKVPASGSSTCQLANLITQDTKHNSFNEYTDSEIKDICSKNGLYKNGTTESNVVSKMQNYSNYINLIKNVGTEAVVVTEFDYLIASKAINRLRDCFYFFSVSHPKYRIDTNGSKNQVHIEYQAMFLATINGIEFKCMVDSLLFDHSKKTIRPIDIKTGALSVEDKFMEEAFCYYNYYIQSGIYRKIVVEYFKYHHVYRDYTVENFSFIYSTTNPKTAINESKCWEYEIAKETYHSSFVGFNVPGWKPESKNPIEFKRGIVELFNIYKDNVINPSTRQDLLKEIDRLEGINLPF